MKKEKSCGAVVFNDKNEVLLVTHNLGHTDFPKGHVEANETEEETGINIKVNTFNRVVITYSPKEDVIKDVVFFKAEETGGSLKAQLEEVKEVKWVSIEEAFLQLTYNSAKEVLKKIIGSDKL